MLAFSKHHDLRELDVRLRDAPEATAELYSDVIAGTRRRFPSSGRIGKTARLERLIATGAWVDAALALLDLELPQWRIRRMAYDEGEWHCALSRQRELPEWLDQSIDGHHADLPLAILAALMEARAAGARASQTSVPVVPRAADALHEPVLIDNFA